MFRLLRKFTRRIFPEALVVAGVRSGPWYSHFREEFGLATKFLVAFVRQKDILEDKDWDTYEKESLANFIFVSNNIEGEAIPLGQTKELLVDYFPIAPDLFPKVSEFMWKGGGLSGLAEMLKKDLSANLELRQLHPDPEKENRLALALVAKYGTKQRAAFTAVRHFTATQTATLYVAQRQSSLVKRMFYDLYEQAAQKKQIQIPMDLKELRTKLGRGRPKLRSLLSERKIKELHSTMSKGLIDSRFAGPGEYRNHRIMTGFDSHYPSPDRVPEAMRNFIEGFKDRERANLHPIVLAAWASTQFVQIHPFSDFNGRLSRLIMNMILRVHGMPFWLALRSDGNSKQKYIYSLRKYFRDKRPIVTLISNRLSKQFKDLNRVLNLSGLDQIDPQIASDVLNAEMSDEDLLQMPWIYQFPGWIRNNEFSKENFS